MAKKFVPVSLVLVGLVLLTLMMAACGDGPSAKEAFPAPKASADPIPAGTPGPVPGAKLTFPQDEAPHNSITEWWYYTGHLNTTDGGKYGFEYVIFQGIRANFPPGYVSHFAVTDLNKKSFKYDQRIVASQKEVNFGGKNGFALAVGDWTMQGVAGTDRLKATMQDGSFGLDMTVKDTKGLVLHGGGLFSYGPAGSSYYYSRPRMTPSGTLTVEGQAKTIKDGVAWFDHQWGEFVPLAGGWDWFSLHLDDNTELMLYFLRDDNNKIVDAFGSYALACNGNCNPASSTPAKSVDMRLNDFTITPTAQWTSPATGGVYPSGWNIEVKAQGVPNLKLSVKPVIPEQELDTRRTTGVIYWEGACDVSGTKDGQPLTGQSYVELTGYIKKAS